jgi:hypothetical protein
MIRYRFKTIDEMKEEFNKLRPDDQDAHNNSWETYFRWDESDPELRFLSGRAIDGNDYWSRMDGDYGYLRGMNSIVDYDEGYGDELEDFYIEEHAMLMERYMEQKSFSGVKIGDYVIVHKVARRITNIYKESNGVEFEYEINEGHDYGFITSDNAKIIKKSILNKVK